MFDRLFDRFLVGWDGLAFFFGSSSLWEGMDRVVGRLLAWRSLFPMELAVVPGGDSSAKGQSSRRPRVHGARLNSQDGTLQLISTTLIANPGHLQPYFWQVAKNAGQAEPTFGDHGAFP